jgi:hypothetical protein
MKWVPQNIRQLSDYWHSLANGDAPDRGLFEVEKLLPLLPYLILSDFEFSPFRLRFRLSGTRVDQMTGMNLAGHYLDEFATGSYAEAVNEMLGFYEEAARTGKPRIWTYPWAGDNPHLKLIWAGMFPLKVRGSITQCVSIEDYGEFNIVEDGTLHPDDHQNQRDWSTLHRA